MPKTKAARAVSIGPALAPLPTKVVPSLEDEAKALLANVKTITVRTIADRTAAADLAKQIVHKQKQWEAHEWPGVVAARKLYTDDLDRYNALAKPLKDAVAFLKTEIWRFNTASKRIADVTIRATFAPLASAQDAVLAAHASSVQQASEAVLATRQREIQAAVDLGDTEKATRLIAAPLPDLEIPVDLGAAAPLSVLFGPGDLATALAPEPGISVGDAFDYVVDNPALVPDEYYSIDPKKIKKTIAIFGADTNIPGVRLIPKPKVSIR